MITENGVEGVDLDLKSRNVNREIGLVRLDDGETTADVLGGGLERADLHVEVVGLHVLVVHVQLEGVSVTLDSGNAILNLHNATLAVT